MNSGSCAFLSNVDGYTVFQYGKYTIHFQAPYSLVRYTEIKEWDNGYLVVMAQYAHSVGPVEEYIDLVPILRNLNYDTDEVLLSIKEVRLNYSSY